MTDQNFDQMRRAMVASQLRTNAVEDPRVIDAMGRIARERHVPADRRAAAYIDRAVPLGGGRALNPPMTTGRLLSEAAPQPGETVLVIGAATGYAAALLGELVDKVVALDEASDLLETARAATRSKRVSFVEGPMAEGWTQGAPYDLILIDGAVEHIPAAIIAQLADTGRIATAIAERGVTRLAIGRRSGTGFGILPFVDAEAVILPGFATPKGFTF